MLSEWLLCRQHGVLAVVGYDFQLMVGYVWVGPWKDVWVEREIVEATNPDDIKKIQYRHFILAHVAALARYSKCRL